LLFLALALPCIASADERLEALEEQAFREAAALVSPAVVRIETVGGLEEIAPGLTASGVTSGLVVSADGDIITSAFTFAGKPTSILVTLPDGRRFPARRVSTDRQRMLTLLKIDATGLSTAQAAPRESFRVGQWAIALGRTFDAEAPSVSVGVVSALDRIWGKAIQCDAKVSPVNYGGPLVDIEGRVLGILAPLSPQSTGEAAGVEWYDSGIGFAVPLVDILAVLDRMRDGEDLLPGLIGVTFRGRAAVGAEAVIDRVRINSPAAKAGLLKDDRITGVDGKKVDSITQLRQLLGRKYAGEKLDLAIRRGETEQSVELTLVGELPPFDAGYLGILPSRQTDAPVIVRAVLADSPAAQAGLQPQDKIVRWNDQAIESAKQLADLVSRITPGAEAQVTLERDGATKTVAVTLNGYPNVVAPDVPSEVFANDAEAAPEGKTGRLSATLAGHDREYGLYVPELYRPGRKLGLMVFLQPSRDPMEAALLRAWKAECDRRGLIIAAPQCDDPRGWKPNDLEFVHDCLAKVRADYAVDPQRIWIHAVGEAVPFALLTALRERTTFRGVALVDAAVQGALPESDPDARQQFYFASDPSGRTQRAVQQGVEALRKAKYPTVLNTLPRTEGQYLSDAAVEELARWADSLDRI
jgi:serine protease Do